jgi:hypothetical protein
MAAYRAGVVAADLMAVPGALTTSPQAGGSCAANTYKNKVVAGNGYGRTTPTAGADVITATTNLTVRILFAAVTGATYYDIYVSTDADPKWVGRITEAQRASGILITAVGTTGAGGVAGGVDVQVVGTGLQSATTCAVNTAWAIPAVVNCYGAHYVDFDLVFSRTGDAVAPALTVVPFLQNGDETGYFEKDAVALGTVIAFGGTTGNTQALRQRLRVDVSGVPTAALLVLSMAGTGASLDIWATVVK